MVSKDYLQPLKFEDCGRKHLRFIKEEMVIAGTQTRSVLWLFIILALLVPILKTETPIDRNVLGTYMAAHTFFLHLLIILLTARVFAEFADRLQTPRVMGELFAGILLGPSLLGWIEATEVIKLLAEIGMILLLFEVGLGTDVKRLVRTGMESFWVAMAGFILPFVLGLTLSYWVFGVSLLVSLFIGGTLTATSIGITVRVLTDLNRHQEREGQIVLGAAVIDDVLGVVLLAFLYEFSIGRGINIVNASKVLIFVATFFVLAPIAAKSISLVIKHFDRMSNISGLLPTTVVSLVLFFAWLAHAVGAPELLGGFAAGLALSRRFFLPFGVALRHDLTFADRIEGQRQPTSPIFCHGRIVPEPTRD